LTIVPWPGAALITEVVSTTFDLLFACFDDTTSSDSSDDKGLFFPLAASTSAFPPLSKLLGGLNSPSELGSELGVELVRETGSSPSKNGSLLDPLAVGSAGVEKLAIGDEPMVCRTRGRKLKLPAREALGSVEAITPLAGCSGADEERGGLSISMASSSSVPMRTADGWRSGLESFSLDKSELKFESEVTELSLKRECMKPTNPESAPVLPQKPELLDVFVPEPELEAEIESGPELRWELE
jgi:hypothetical protein